MVRNKKAGIWLGCLSLVLAAFPLIYDFNPSTFPYSPLAEIVILIGGAVGSFLAALIAGIIGSRWWLVAILGAAVDIFYYAP